MAKLSAEERAALEQQLADDDAAGDDDFEFTLSEGERSVTIPWSRRESLGELGFKVPAKAKAPAKPAGQGQKDGGAAPNVSLFGQRQRKTS